MKAQLGGASFLQEIRSVPTRSCNEISIHCVARICRKGVPEAFGRWAFGTLWCGSARSQAPFEGNKNKKTKELYRADINGFSAGPLLTNRASPRFGERVVQRKLVVWVLNLFVFCTSISKETGLESFVPFNVRFMCAICYVSVCSPLRGIHVPLQLIVG